MFALGLPAILSFLGSNFKIILYAAFAAALGYFVVSWEKRGVALEDAALEKATLTANVAELERKQLLWVEAQDAADKRIQQLEDESKDVSTIIQRAQNAPKEDDAVLAPVLQRGLADVNGLLHPTTHR